METFRALARVNSLSTDLSTRESRVGVTFPSLDLEKEVDFPFSSFSQDLLSSELQPGITRLVAEANKDTDFLSNLKFIYREELTDETRKRMESETKYPDHIKEGAVIVNFARKAVREYAFDKKNEIIEAHFPHEDKINSSFIDYLDKMAAYLPEAVRVLHVEKFRPDPKKYKGIGSAIAASISIPEQAWYILPKSKECLFWREGTLIDVKPDSNEFIGFENLRHNYPNFIQPIGFVHNIEVKNRRSLAFSTNEVRRIVDELEQLPNIAGLADPLIIEKREAFHYAVKEFDDSLEASNRNAIPQLKEKILDLRDVIQNQFGKKSIPQNVAIGFVSGSGSNFVFNIKTGRLLEVPSKKNFLGQIRLDYANGREATSSEWVNQAAWIAGFLLDRTVIKGEKLSGIVANMGGMRSDYHPL